MLRSMQTPSQTVMQGQTKTKFKANISKTASRVVLETTGECLYINRISNKACCVCSRFLFLMKKNVLIKIVDL